MATIGVTVGKDEPVYPAPVQVGSIRVDRGTDLNPIRLSVGNQHIQLMGRADALKLARALIDQVTSDA